MPLATLEQVKAKLQVPADDTSEDTAIQAVLHAAETHILDRTGYTLTAGSFTETFQRVQVGRMLALAHRPVATASASARAFGSDTWTPIVLDLVDPEKGLILVPPAGEWPALPGAPPWAAWREWTWHVVKVDYTTTALEVPADLSDACAALAAFWYRQHLAGAVTDISLGQVREAYSTLGLPPNVEVVLARHERGVTWWG